MNNREEKKIRQLAHDDLLCVAAFTAVRDCVTLLMALNSPMWSRGINIDRTRNVNAKLLLHHRLLSSYKSIYIAWHPTTHRASPLLLVAMG